MEIHQTVMNINLTYIVIERHYFGFSDGGGNGGGVCGAIGNLN